MKKILAPTIVAVFVLALPFQYAEANKEVTSSSQVSPFSDLQGEKRISEINNEFNSVIGIMEEVNNRYIDSMVHETDGESWTTITYTFNSDGVEMMYNRLQTAESLTSWASYIVGLVPNVGLTAALLLNVQSNNMIDDAVAEAYHTNSRLEVELYYGNHSWEDETTYRVVN
ncbi:hypothetical protein [Shouchella clausii]|uniref:hypothetical protein n=1 Tax=Shouchella clausii TaxID=79880 RepID=UPI000BA70AE1|nr:hypothetical protein [Shouchella clausii]PAE96552.1 hypothetical protein CHH70_01185 [Shouchella clausii]